MKKFIVFLVFLLTTWCGFGQISFNFSPMSNPDPNLVNISQILLLDNEALSGNSGCQLYYNGSSWSVLSSVGIGGISGIKTSNGIYAVNSGWDIRLWNDSGKNWLAPITKPSQITYTMGAFVKAEDDIYFVGFDQAENVGWLWHWDGNTFSDIRSDYWYSYCGIYVKDASNIFLITYKNINYGNLFIRINDVTKSQIILYTFPSNRGTPSVIASRDNNVFFILTGCGDLYRWTNDQSTMDLIYEASTSDYNYFGRNLIVIDNNNVIACGRGGIRHINVSSSVTNVIYSTSFNFSVRSGSYNNHGRAIFTGDNGLILDMQVIGSVPGESIANALNLYPNPAENSVTLEFPVFGVEEKTVELYSSTGQLVKAEKFRSFTTTLDISTLPSGIYLVNVKDETGKKLASRKLLVR